MSFVTQEDVFETVEPVITGIFEQFGEGKPVTKKWPRIPYAEAMRKYGSDKPDLRNPLIMQNVSEHFRDSGFKVFARMLEQPKNEVWALPAPGGGSRTFCDRMNSWAQSEGQPGLGYISLAAKTALRQVPMAKNIGPRAAPKPSARARPQGRRRGVFRGGRPGQVREICWRRAAQKPARN